MSQTTRRKKQKVEETPITLEDIYNQNANNHAESREIYNKLISEITNIKENQVKIENEIEMIKKRSERIYEKVDMRVNKIEQRELERVIEIKGVSSEVCEKIRNVKNYTVELCSQFKIHIDDSMIDSAYVRKIEAENKSPFNIIVVKFKNEEIKNIVMKKKLEACKNDNKTLIYFDLALTGYNRALLRKVKKHKDDLRISQVYFRNGKIHLKHGQHDKPTLIQNFDELDKLLTERHTQLKVHNEMI